MILFICLHLRMPHLLCFEIKLCTFLRSLFICFQYLFLAPGLASTVYYLLVREHEYIRNLLQIIQNYFYVFLLSYQIRGKIFVQEPTLEFSFSMN